MSTAYSIQVFSINGETRTEAKLSAKTDRGARQQAKKYMKTAEVEFGDLVKLCWFRYDDGCQGVLDTLKDRAR